MSYIVIVFIVFWDSLLTWDLHRFILTGVPQLVAAARAQQGQKQQELQKHGTWRGDVDNGASG